MGPPAWHPSAPSSQLCLWQKGWGGAAGLRSDSPRVPSQETEKIIAELNETWEEKLRKTEAIRTER